MLASLLAQDEVLVWDATAERASVNLERSWICGMIHGFDGKDDSSLKSSWTIMCL